MEMERSVDVLQCSICGSRRRWIAAHFSTAKANGETIMRILKHLGLESVAAAASPPRAPPQLELAWEGA
jgi:hypothetical protein